MLDSSALLSTSVFESMLCVLQLEERILVSWTWPRMILPEVSYSPNYSRLFLRIIGKPPKAVGRELVDDRLYIWSLWLTWWPSTLLPLPSQVPLSLFNFLHTVPLWSPQFCLVLWLFVEVLISLWLACSLVFSKQETCQRLCGFCKNFWAVC